MWTLIPCLCEIPALSRRSWAWFKRDSDAILRLFQLAALVIGGYWTYTRFIEGVKPTLSPVAIASGSITSGQGVRPNQCISNLDVVVANIGIPAIQVNSVRIRAWITDVPPLVPGDIVYLDHALEERKNPVMDRSFNSGALVKLYPTHSSANQSFQFSTVQNKYLLATADFEALDSVRISHIWAFARVCPPGAPPVPQQFNFQFLQK